MLEEESMGARFNVAFPFLLALNRQIDELSEAMRFDDYEAALDICEAIFAKIYAEYYRRDPKECLIVEQEIEKLDRINGSHQGMNDPTIRRRVWGVWKKINTFLWKYHYIMPPDAKGFDGIASIKKSYGIKGF